MRKALSMLLAGLASAVSYWMSLMLMLALEGIGPGDSLSTAGQTIPILLAVAVSAVIVWLFQKRTGPLQR